MSIQILSNLNYPIGNIINQELQNAQSARIAIAFLKYSGIKVIEKSLNQCLDNNGSVEIIAGLDFKTTDPQSMHYLIQLQKTNPNLKFYCYGDKDVNKNNVVFHPKIYLFQGKRETTGIVGSTNLTSGGLMTNFEANVIFKENKPLYFSQIEAIYNSVKFTDSVFSPDEEYLSGYSEVYKAFLQNEQNANQDKSVQDVINLGQELYKRFNTVSQYFSKIGRHLNQSVDSYNQTLASFENRLIPVMRRFQDIKALKTDTAPEPFKPIDAHSKSPQSMEFLQNEE